jgi:hypothetical protein
MIVANQAAFTRHMCHAHLQGGATALSLLLPRHTTTPENLRERDWTPRWIKDIRLMMCVFTFVSFLV